jgi:hypothetical protein
VLLAAWGTPLVHSFTYNATILGALIPTTIPT